MCFDQIIHATLHPKFQSQLLDLSSPWPSGRNSTASVKTEGAHGISCMYRRLALGIEGNITTQLLGPLREVHLRFDLAEATAPQALHEMLQNVEPSCLEGSGRST